MDLLLELERSSKRCEQRLDVVFFVSSSRTLLELLKKAKLEKWMDGHLLLGQQFENLNPGNLTEILHQIIDQSPVVRERIGVFLSKFSKLSNEPNVSLLNRLNPGILPKQRQTKSLQNFKLKNFSKKLTLSDTALCKD